MRERLLGASLLLAAFAFQAGSAGALSPGGLSADWIAIALLWYGLHARPSRAVAVAWAAGWGVESLSSAPPGMSAVTLSAAGFLAVSVRERVRRDSFLAVGIWTVGLVLPLLAAQAAWVAVATGADAEVVSGRFLGILCGTALAALPASGVLGLAFSWALQPGQAEAFSG